MRDVSRSKQVMSVELAMQREMEFHKKLESSQERQGNKTMKDSPVQKSGMSVPILASGYGPRLIGKESTRPTSSSWFKQSQLLNPGSIPKGGSGPHLPRTQAPCLPPMNSMPPQNRNASSRFVAKFGSQPGSCQARQKSEPTPQQRPPKPVIVLPKPNLNQPQGPSIPPRSMPSPDPYSHPRLQTRPNFTANPFPGPGQELTSGPTQKRKEAPNQKFQTVKSVKMSKLYCELCKVTCSSPGNLEDHMKGQKHQSKKKMREFGSQIGMNDPQVLFCELCGVWCMNELCYHQHLNGKSHIHKLHTAQK